MGQVAEDGLSVSNETVELGSRIRGIRRQRGLTQAELASSELSESYISLIESGKRKPGPRTLRLLAERLGLTVDELTKRVVTPDPQISFALAFVELAVMNGDPDAAQSAIAAIHADHRLDPQSAARLL